MEDFSAGHTCFTIDHAGPPAKCLDWRSCERGPLRGFATIQFTSGQIIADIAVHHRGHCWASPPSKPMIDTATGTALRDDDGKIRYLPVIRFSTRAVRSNWSRQVIAAIRAAHPDAVPPEDPEAELGRRFWP